MPRDQTMGNDNKDAVSDFHQSEDKRNCYIYVTFVVIIKLTFVMLLLKQSTGEPRLSRLVGTSVNSPDNRESG